MIGSLLKQTPEKTATQVDKFTTEHDAVAERLAYARAAYGVALVDEAEGLTDSKAVAAMRQELADLESELTAKAAALVEARRRHQQAVAAAQGDALTSQWSAAAAIAAKRQKAAKRLAAASEEFASAYRGVVDANAELYGALPANPDPAATLTIRADIERALRLELWRLGVTWAISWPWGKEHIEPLASRFEDATAVVQAMAQPYRH